MEDLVARSFGGAYRGRRVLVTGHTGFKGAWLCEWLLGLGARVHGLALPAPTEPALFDQLQLGARLERHQLGDIQQSDAVQDYVERVDPEVVFHLAAQPLVRDSYLRPVETFSTNVLGTAHVLEAVRRRNRPCAVVAVTTDKAYENREWVHSYREDDALGGHDPYSASKAAAELVIQAYRRSYFSAPDSVVRLASARAGNVIGGGDWARDRIIPDAMRSLERGLPIPVRNPEATRPWQHVLEPLSGYLLLGARLLEVVSRGPSAGLPGLDSPFNFGPGLEANLPVRDLVTALLQHWPGSWVDASESNPRHEANRLNLATDKAHHLLGWRPVWSFQETVAHTTEWYRQHSRSLESPRHLTRAQLVLYLQQASARGLVWSPKAEANLSHV
jgi:CDP-glucose 4,6-dehydratase